MSFSHRTRCSAFVGVLATGLLSLGVLLAQPEVQADALEMVAEVQSLEGTVAPGDASITETSETAGEDPAAGSASFDAPAGVQLGAALGEKVRAELPN